MPNRSAPADVSVVTVVRNGEAQIERTLRSVRAQHGCTWEHIIVDGDSTDRTLDVVRRYASEHAIVVSEADGGIYQALNKGVALATGALIGLIHAGDEYLPDTLTRACSAFRASGADIVYGDMLVTDEDTTGLPEARLFRADHRRLRREMSLSHPATFVSRACYDEVGPYDTSYRIAADYDWFLRATLAGRSFAHVPQPLVIFDSGGLSGSRPWLSIRENTRVRWRRLGLLPAVRFAFSRTTRLGLLGLRRKLLLRLLGRRRFHDLRRAHRGMRVTPRTG